MAGDRHLRFATHGRWVLLVLGSIVGLLLGECLFRMCEPPLGVPIAIGPDGRCMTGPETRGFFASLGCRAPSTECRQRIRTGPCPP